MDTYYMLSDIVLRRHYYWLKKQGAIDKRVQPPLASLVMLTIVTPTLKNDSRSGKHGDS